MIYVFEDKRDDILSCFFRQAYPNDISDKFIYTNGNGCIVGIVQQLLMETQETIVVNNIY